MRRSDPTDDPATIAAMISSPIRRRILQRLRREPCVVGDLAAELGVQQAQLSKQIGLLRDSGLLACRPEGRCRCYELADPEAIGRLLDALDAAARSCAAQVARCRRAAPIPTPGRKRRAV